MFQQNFWWTRLVDGGIVVNMEINSYKRDEHRIYLIIYHLVWTPKRRKPVLTGNVAKDCEALIAIKCKEYGWRIIELAIQPDYIHLFVETFSTIPASEVVKQCKGVTSHELREKYPFLKKNFRHYGHAYTLLQLLAMFLLKPSRDTSKHKKVSNAQSI